jgi:hypothetical protein
MKRDEIVKERLDSINQSIKLTHLEREIIRVSLELAYEYGGREALKEFMEKNYGR